MTDNQKQWLTWIIMTLATLAIALFFGVQYPMPDQPEEPIDPVELEAHFSNPIDIEGSASASAPALTFQGDTDTGFWRSAANTLNVAAAGSEILEMDASQISAVPGATFGGNTTINGNLTVTGTTNLQGNVSDSTSEVIVADQFSVVGQENAQQMWVQGYTTQTANLFTAYSSALNTYFAVEGDGEIDLRGNVHDAGGDLTIQDNIVVTGTADLQGNVSDSGGDVTVADNLAVTGTLDVQGGAITLQNDDTINNQTSGSVAIPAEFSSLQYVEDKTANYTIVIAVAETGALFTNDGATGAITITLPNCAVEGIYYGFIAQDDHDLIVSTANAGNQILSCTDAAGASCSLDTQFDATWLVCDGDGDWLLHGTVGTLVDLNDE